VTRYTIFDSPAGHRSDFLAGQPAYKWDINPIQYQSVVGKLIFENQLPDSNALKSRAVKHEQQAAIVNLMALRVGRIPVLIRTG
jgi:hypothetical protein